MSRGMCRAARRQREAEERRRKAAKRRGEPVHEVQGANMPRRARVQKRVILPDGKYGSRTVSKFINRIMLKGKKSTAEGIVYDAMERLERNARRPALDLFEQALRNATPLLEVKPRRVGGATYQVPVEIKGDRRQALAMRWLIRSARARNGKS